MKLKTNLLLGALAALSIASASADVTYLTGATSYQQVTDKALTNFVAQNGGALVTSDNATLGSETNEILTWQTNGVTNLIIVHWTGSELAIQTLAAPTNNPALIPFYPTNTPTGIVSTNGLAGYPNNQSAQVALYDNYQATSIFHGTAAGDGRTYSTIQHDQKTSAQGFVFVANTNWPVANGTNITVQQARTLFESGSLPVSLITGVSSDTNNTVYAIGRNIDGGTRTQVLAETGIGVKGNIVQFYVAASNNIYQYPIEVIDGITNATVGQSGYASDGAERAVLKTALASGQIDTSATQWSNAVPNVPSRGNNYLITYTATAKLPSAGAVPFSYNGVASTTANIENGTYSLWGYTHIAIANGSYATSPKNAATTLWQGLYTILTSFTDAQLGNGNANLNNLQVSRSTDGALIVPNFVQ